MLEESKKQTPFFTFAPSNWSLSMSQVQTIVPVLPVLEVRQVELQEFKGIWDYFCEDEVIIFEIQEIIGDKWH